MLENAKELEDRCESHLRVGGRCTLTQGHEGPHLGPNDERWNDGQPFMPGDVIVLKNKVEVARYLVLDVVVDEPYFVFCRKLTGRGNGKEVLIDAKEFKPTLVN